jgi:bifunctional non-homologous end joining protein LigD
MLATAGELPVGSGWAFEFKWDGVRAIAVIDGATMRLYARSGAEITRAYPELASLGAALTRAGLDRVILDGEVVVLDPQGRPSFTALAERMHVREAGRAAQLAVALPVTYMIFDVLTINDEALRDQPYTVRRGWLDALADRLGPGARWLVPPSFDDGAATVAASNELGLEGVVAKRLDAPYRPGLRSPDWIKIKNDQTGEYVVGGWRPGQRELGALLVGALRPDGRLDYRGRVGGGISAASERNLLARVRQLAATESPFAGALPREDARDAHYVRPELVVEVRYGNRTPDGRLRFPRFVRLRPDKSPAEADDA